MKLSQLIVEEICRWNPAEIAGIVARFLKVSELVNKHDEAWKLTLSNLYSTKSIIEENLSYDIFLVKSGSNKIETIKAI
jgi:hypothetical protein